MTTLRGIIKRVIRREGRVGRIGLMIRENVRSVNRLSSRTAVNAATGLTTTFRQRGGL